MKILDGYQEKNLHFKWSPENKPVMDIEPGETITIRIPDSSTMQIKRNFTASDMRNIDNSRVDAAVGPVYVHGAKPGDVLKVKIEKIETGNWGWSAIIDNFGVLSNRFQEKLVIWGIDKNEAETEDQEFLRGVKIPIEPFLGITGTAPAEGSYGMIPPQNFGGNMDNRFLKEGSVLYLPVNVDGALVSFADPHAAQGDGEVCGTAIETSCEATVNIDLIHDMHISYPRLESFESVKSSYMVSMGIGKSMEDAARDALKEMIAILNGHGFTAEEGYILCSVAGKLRISEMVDMPNFVVSMALDKDLISR
ncbi:acetamidase/formamidase family protein [Ferroplasma sp.]|uniref:acetamidase/formamidase family protein n=1 Tax=Ferroplasma sp. TaxID=2591003 RepID=UPI0026030295|nr:acetamidase/formamidase family protein [Ferroplasma sp.]MCL4453944.1 acetamidase/formamidase family protein [Candidatus Thermoplasmatota archaeon]